MSAHASPNIITDGLAFMYDTGSGKSYKGEPTINYIHSQNAVAKDSYSTWSATAAGTYNAKHPNAIAAYNAAGTQISGYYNSGVSDATNTYHAHWQYDPILKKPVVVMNDVAGTWQAKWMSTGLGSWNSQGKSHGDTYTISWLQWVDHLSKNAKAGLYTKNTSGSNGFHDGQANSASSYNTTLHTWQRVYQTYTTSTARDLSQTLASIYMYGQYNVRATVKVADVQFTWGSHPVQFSAEYERSATQGLLDLTGNSTIDISDVSFDSDAEITFDGTDDKAVIANFPHVWNSSLTLEAVVSWNDDSRSVIFGNYNVGANDINFEKLTSRKLRFYWNRGERDVVTSSNVVTTSGDYHHVVFTRGTTFRIYVDGVLVTESSGIGTNVASTGSTFRVGGDTRNGATIHNGNIPVLKIYNKALTASEVLQNFNATKSRFGL